MLPEKVEAFSKKFEEVVSLSIDPYLLVPELVIHTEIGFKNINNKFFKIIEQMEPYGPENMRPVFVTKNVLNTSWTRIVKESHIRFVLKNENVTLSGIGFNLAEKFSLLNENKPIDIVFTIDENEWNGQVSLQLKIIDFQLSNAENNN